MPVHGIKALLQLLQPRVLTPPGSLDCLRALSCRVLLGLARDEPIAHILAKLQVEKKLSELIRDSGGQSSVSEQGRWEAELAQVAMELIALSHSLTGSQLSFSLEENRAYTKVLENNSFSKSTPSSITSEDW